MAIWVGSMMVGWRSNASAKAVAGRDRGAYGPGEPSQSLAGVLAQRLQRHFERQAGADEKGQFAAERWSLREGSWRLAGRRATARQHAGRGDPRSSYGLSIRMRRMTSSRVGASTSPMTSSTRGAWTGADSGKCGICFRLETCGSRENTSSMVVTPARHFAMPSSIIVLIPSLRAESLRDRQLRSLARLLFRTPGVTSITSKQALAAAGSR